MKFDERELRTLDHLVKMAEMDNEHGIQLLEEKFPDYVALYNSETFQSRLTQRDHLAQLSCKIFGELAGVKVEVKLKRSAS